MAAGAAPLGVDFDQVSGAHRAGGRVVTRLLTASGRLTMIGDDDHDAVSFG